MSAISDSPIAFQVEACRSIPQRILLPGIGLLSFAALLLELALTRLFSVVLFYHFAFLAISIALLGLGAGGVCAYLGKAWLGRFETRGLVGVLCLMNALSVVVALEVVLHLPVSLEFTRENFLRLTAMYLSCAVPFFLTGIGISTIFGRESRHIPRLYGADLAGGASACLAAVPLLNWIGGPNTILFSAFMAAVAGLVWARTANGRKWATALAACLVTLIAGNYSGRLIDIVYAKGVLRDRAWVEFARWNAISRVEVDRQGGAKAVVIDADASTYIMNADPQHWTREWQDNLMSAPPALANVLRPRGAYAIIGPGGGVDVLRALASGSHNITGIEINPIIANTVMRDRYSDYSYHLYQRPEVQIEVTDGRSFVRNAHQQYDVVQMTLVDTWASTAAGAFALSENSLYTVEAFQEYFDHLKPDGMIAITRWEFRHPREALRVVSVAMEALHRIGVSNTARNFIVVSQGALDEDGIPVVVLAKKSAFTDAEEHAVIAHIARYPTLTPLYLPSEAAARNSNQSNAGVAETPALSNAFSDLIASDDPDGFARKYAYNVAPVTDDAPFFFFTLKLGDVLRDGSLARAIDWKVNLGVVVLGTVLIVSAAAVLIFLVIPLALHRRDWPARALPLTYFIAIGLGYILVEIAFVQRFVLFLGHPTYALTVVIFLMLLASGAGSLISRAWLSETSRLWIPLVLVTAALLFYVFALPGLLDALVGLPFLLKLLVSAMLLAPLGFAMGMPFPTGLRILARISQAAAHSRADGQSSIEWAWAVNAASSVLGSVAAMVIAIQFGLNVTLACGAAAYGIALMLTPVLNADEA